MHSESEIPSFTKCLRKLVKVFEKEKIDYMVIGGLALPAYGQVRATQDIDVAMAVKTVESLKSLLKRLGEQSFQVTSKPILEAACTYVFDLENAVDVEIWQKPDGITFDEELFRRRKRVEVAKNLSVWIIGPEDFIINKLARTDRRAQDENDVLSVLEGQKGKLDRKYLIERAREAGVLALLEALERKLRSMT